MSQSQTSPYTLSPDRSPISTLGSIWTSRHKAKPVPMTNVEAARRQMDMGDLEWSEIGRGPNSHAYLIVVLLAGAALQVAIFAAFYQHTISHAIRSVLTGGR